MNDTIWPAFMMAPFIPPSTSATSSAVRMANCSSSRARWASVARRPRSLITPQWAVRRADRRQTRAWRSTRWRRASSAKATPTPTPAAPRRATPAAARGTSRRTVRSSRRAAARNRPPRVELRTLLVLEAEAGGGPGREALLVDRLAARLARAVRALVQALEGVLHVGQLGFDAFQDRQVLLPLERLRPEVGLVLVDGGELGQRLLLRLVGEVFVGEPLLGALEARPLFRS